MEMNQQQALEVLINAVKVAQKRGAFELEETPMIFQAVTIFMPPQTPQSNVGNSAEGGEE